MLAFGIATFAQAQSLPKTDPSLERLYQYPLLNGRSPSAPAISPDGSKIVFGWNQTGARKLDVWVLDYSTGSKKKIVDSSKITDLPRQDDERTDQEKAEETLYDGGIAGFKWSPDSKQILFNYKRRTWLVDPDGSDLHPIIDGAQGLADAQYSPDGQFLAYRQGQNVFRLDRKTSAVKQLTFISKGNTSLEGYEWSPDSKKLLVTWSDNSKDGRHVMMDFSKDRATVVNISRMWNGDLSVNNQFGIVGVDGGIIKWIPNIPRYLWTQATEWSPNSKWVVISYISEDFRKWNLSLVDTEKPDLKPFSLVQETSPESGYIEDFRPAFWSRNSKRIYYGTDIEDGKFINRSLFSIALDGKDVRKEYVEKHDIGFVTRPKDSDRIVMVTAARSPLKTEITILEPDGKRNVHVVMENGYSSPKAFNGAESPLISDDGTKIATMASDRTINAELYAVEPKPRRLTESQSADFAKIKWAKVEEVSFKTADGRMIHGLVIADPNLDLSKKHPAIVSGIYADSGKAAWNGWMENYAAMNLGMVVLCVDFRSSWGYDGDFNSGYYKKLGLVDADEAVAAKDYLASLPYVRGDRVGIWGWSYGGYLTCMTLLTKPGVFHAGVAVASVTNWKSYNEWYTRRRLGLVKDDKDKLFEKTSPVTYAAGLQDHLLLVHGLLDDNVLFQDTAQLIQKLIENGKHFDLMVYPRDDHGMGKDTSRPHVFVTIMNYLYEKLAKD